MAENENNETEETPLEETAVVEEPAEAGRGARCRGAGR